MTRIRLIMLSMLAVFAGSAVASASASAACDIVAVAGTGQFEDGACTKAVAPKEYIKILKIETRLKSGEWCAKVETAGTGTFSDNKCTNTVGAKEYIKVLVPEFRYKCKEQTTATFVFTENKCLTRSAGEDTGKFENEPVPAGSKIKFTDTEKESHLYGPFSIIVTCKADTSKGEITGPKTTAGDTVTFTGCTAKEGEKKSCPAKSTGEPAGTIKTEELKDTLGTVAEAEATSKVGEALEPQGTKGFVTIEAPESECLKITPTQVSGSVIGEVKPIEVMQTTGELIFTCNATTKTKQTIQKFVGFPKDILSAFTSAACFESKAEITFAEPIEVEYP